MTWDSGQKALGRMETTEVSPINLRLWVESIYKEIERNWLELSSVYRVEEEAKKQSKYEVQNDPDIPDPSGQDPRKKVKIGIESDSPSWFSPWSICLFISGGQNMRQEHQAEKSALGDWEPTKNSEEIRIGVQESTE